MKDKFTKKFLAAALCLGIPVAGMAQADTIRYGVDITDGGVQIRKTAGNITATNDISGVGQDVTYAAGGVIILRSGFSVTEKANFTARRYDPNTDSRLSAEALYAKSSSQSELKIYPNPLADRTTIEFYSDDKFKNEIIIHNSAGQVVKRISINPTEFNLSNKLEIDTSDFPIGLYIIETTVGKKKLTRKILKY
jgi:hypothetical protein